MGCGEGYLGESGKIAHAAGGAPPPQQPKELPAGPSRDEIIEHVSTLSQLVISVYCDVWLNPGGVAGGRGTHGSRQSLVVGPSE